MKRAHGVGLIARCLETFVGSKVTAEGLIKSE